MKIYKVLIFAISLLMITSCGSGNSHNDSAKDNPDNIGNIDDTDNQETQKPEHELVTNMQIPMKGSNQKVDIVVRSKKNTATVEIKSVPSVFAGQMKKFTGSFYPTEEECKKVREYANSKMIYTVRKLEDSRIKFISRVNFLRNEFITEILEEVEKAINIDRTNITFMNILKLENVSYSIDFDSDAISNILGNTDTFATNLDHLRDWVLRYTGSKVLGTPFTDLVCDLYLKKAHLKLRYQFSIGNNNIVNVVENFDEFIQ